MEGSAQGKKMIGERDLRVYLDKCAPWLAAVYCQGRCSLRDSLDISRLQLMSMMRRDLYLSLHLASKG